MLLTLNSKLVWFKTICNFESTHFDRTEIRACKQVSLLKADTISIIQDGKNILLILYRYFERRNLVSPKQKSDYKQKLSAQNLS